MSQGAGAVDPRIARSRRMVREAALEELADAGYGGFRIESVARRAGVGKSTVYRLWGGKLALIADALEVLNVQPSPEGQGPPRARIERLLHHLAEALRGSVMSACMPALIHAAERDPAVRSFLEQYSSRRRAALTAALADGIERGDIRPDLDPERASLALSGAVLYRRLLIGRAMDPAEVPPLVDTVLGSRPSGAPAQAGS